MKYMTLTALLFACLVLPAGDWSSKGEVTAEARQFTDDNDPQTRDTGLGLFSRLETGLDNGGWRFRLRGFARVDHEDDSRGLAALEEAWLGYRGGAWDLRLGFQMLNWTATEAFHPADIVNSRNLDSNIENPEKLGELMLSLRRKVGNGGLTLYYLPRLEEPNLPEASSRLSFIPPGFTIGRPIWLVGDGEASGDSWADQYGVRFNQTVGDADFSVHYLDHLDRQQPRFDVDAARRTIRPVYSSVRDLGATYLHVLGSWILKLEASHKDFQGQSGAFAQFNQMDHSQLAFGLDYGWSTQGGGDATVILEGQGVFGTTEEERAALSPFQRDLLVGYRHAWNDIMGREMLVTFIFDIERSGEYLANTSYKQRLSDTWTLQTGFRWIEAEPEGPLPVGLENLHEANQIYLNISRFF